jgi:hypothetical protein
MSKLRQVTGDHRLWHRIRTDVFLGHHDQREK